MFKAVIFDMDGVIIDSEPVHLKLEYEIYNELGIDITREEHSTFVGTTSHYMWDTLKKKINFLRI
jgi:beta-phosphoglucomutase-like phosphatase (HAD superfamily)